MFDFFKNFPKNLTFVQKLKLCLKIGAYIMVVIDLIEIAIEKFEAISEKDKPKKIEKDVDKGSN